jgi:NagD protein
VIATRAERRYEGYVFDLDGTLYVDEGATPGAREALAWVRATGAAVAFLTNNPLRRGSAYAEKLRWLGIEAREDEVITSLDALVAYLVAHPPAGPVLALTEPLVQEVLAEAGFGLTSDPAEAAMVVVSWDRGFDYAKLLAGFRAVRSGARIVATNPDPFCPTADGGLPDCAAMLAALEACTGARAEAVVGKPSVHMASAILGHLGLPASEVLMIGDRLLTDVGLARTAGMVSGLALTGATTLDDAEAAERPPDLCLARLTDIIPEGDDTRYQLVVPAAPEARA